MPYELPNLNFEYDALEPHLDALTMEIHHSKHHAAYTANLNAAIEGTEMSDKTIEELLIEHQDNPAIRNNGGGFWNHCLFWETLSANPTSPSNELLSTINDKFGCMDELKGEIKSAALKRFGSGWAWLCTSAGSLSVCSTPNQDNPLMTGEGVPILGVDVWEHAYYKKFGPARGDYVDSWWNVINWDKVSEIYDKSNF